MFGVVARHQSIPDVNEKRLHRNLLVPQIADTFFDVSLGSVSEVKRAVWHAKGPGFESPYLRLNRGVASPTPVEVHAST